MKICHINLASSYHGGENQTIELIKQQLKEQHQLTVIAKKGSPFAHAVENLGIEPIFSKHALQGHSKALADSCSLVHVHQGRAIYWALVQYIVFGTPYIVTRRIDNPLKKKWLANLAYSKASAIIGLSTKIVQCINTAYPKIDTFQIPSSPVTYSVDTSQVAKIKSKYHEKFIVIQAANMLKHKGFHVTIEASKRLQSINPNIHICLLGDGKDKLYFQSLAKGLANISFEGQQNNMGDWFAAADLQVHPSITEGLGSVILEGAKAGLPIIASKTGGIPDIIEDGINGILIEPGDAKKLAESINELYYDKPRRVAFSEQSQKKLMMFDITHTSQLYKNIYQRVIQ